MHPNLRGLSAALVGSGHQCFFIVEGIGASEEKFVPNRRVCDPRDSLENWQEVLAEIRPDLVVQRNFNGGFIQLWKLAKFAGIPVVRYSQDPSEAPFKDFLYRPARVVRFLRDRIWFRVILGNHRTLTPVSRWGSHPGRLIKNVTYFPFPIVRTPPKMQKPVKPLTVLCVAKHGQRRKRVIWLLRALTHSRDSFRLILVGSSPPTGAKAWNRYDNKLRKRAETLGSRAKDVVFFDDVSELELGRLYRGADLFVLPAKREMMAISPLEAMAHGLPVLVSSDGGAASYVREAGKEQVFRARSYGDFQDKFARLREDQSLRSRLVEQGAGVLVKKHSPDKLQDSLKSLLQEVKHREAESFRGA